MLAFEPHTYSMPNHALYYAYLSCKSKSCYRGKTQQGMSNHFPAVCLSRNLEFEISQFSQQYLFLLVFSSTENLDILLLS